MKKYPAVLLFLILLSHAATLAQTTAAPAQSTPMEIPIHGAPIPTRVLVQSPAETVTDLQIICLFASEKQNALRGALAEINDRLHGLLDQIRQPTLFRGELGETLLIEPRGGSIGAKRLLLVGLGDRATFTPSRMELIGAIVYRESSRLEIAHPYFAPTVIDGGVTKFGTGEVAESFIVGFRRGAKTDEVLKKQGTAQRSFPRDLTYLAGPIHATDTQKGIEKGFASGRNQVGFL
jgi:hypothetical protein